MTQKEKLAKSSSHHIGVNGSTLQEEIAMNGSLNGYKTHIPSYGDLENEEEPDTINALRSAGIKFGKPSGSIWKPGDRNVV